MQGWSKVLIGVGTVALLGALPIWKYEQRPRTGWGHIYERFIVGHRTKHVPTSEAIANTKARYMIGIRP